MTIDEICKDTRNLQKGVAQIYELEDTVTDRHFNELKKRLNGESGEHFQYMIEYRYEPGNRLVKVTKVTDRLN